ncbi:NitT/TauT family transport system ATP-binding protein [Terrimicrobium sacchariphilum]|uniref:NitT/TauT family transport system ATP-binding protein n=1 Tax=Terrimicrobium sacchariphilum TaxID=690879 RepID=A0A146G5P5_TERSA|nr:ABC transporter ATP-binding protein [Terrimicrobium sacchariphilum]GAT32713.1 NitT/TauT family transport system ATP-binding protein [Terrimicrobium sacchariphilum]
MALELSHITKTFRTGASEVCALEDCSFTVNDGEFVSLIGPSGCGKSTLLYIAAGLEEATSGTVMLDDRALRGPGKERGMVFQNYTLYPWLTVEQNIKFPFRLKANMDYARPNAVIMGEIEYAGHLLEIMGLAQFRNRYPRELSGGMKQRVAIARALTNKPRILLMDEPFGALDAQTREELQELMLLLGLYEKTTTLLVTHDIEEAIYLADRVIVLSARPGRILEEIIVPFPKDRLLDIKLTPEFLALKRRLVDLLHAGGRPSSGRAEILERLGQHFHATTASPVTTTTNQQHP